MCPAQRYDDFKLIRITGQAACHDKTEHGIFVKFKKPAKLLSSYLPVSPSRVLRAPALHRTIWCQSTFGPRGPGLSNPTSFPRPALPMAPTRDDNARDKRSVLRPNPVTFSRDFALYMTTNYAIIRKRCLNINPFNGIDEYTRHHMHDVIWFKFEKKLHGKGVNQCEILQWVKTQPPLMNSF